jgi:OOP family OmpA-OmpF porin
MPMNRKSLSALIALSLGMAANVQAQDYDDRWYVAPYIGYYNNDDDRLTDDGSVLFGMGIGKYIAPNASLEFFIDRTTRDFNLFARTNFDVGTKLNDTVYGLAARWYFGDGTWRPFVMAGAGISNHRGGVEDGWDGAFQVGAGLQRVMTDNVNFRAELGYRYDLDSESLPADDNFGDFMVNVGVTMAIGEPPEPPAPPAAAPLPTPEPNCSQLDDDRDGVNNCDDKCPNSAAGTIVGPDGCPQDVVIDLRGVEFKFDRPGQGETDIGPTLKEPSSEGIAVLDQAVDVLNRYPQVRVEVAGHTDSTGTEEYNQGLSERRAKIVYDYLTAHGVDAGRLVGPNGYGELRPIDTNDTREGRQRNRRTELAVQK